MGIRRDAVVEVFIFVLDAGQQGLEVAGVVEGEAEDAAAPMGVAAAHVLGRLFQNQNLFGAVLNRRNAGGEGGVARPDNNDIVLSQLSFSLWPGSWRR